MLPLAALALLAAAPAIIDNDQVRVTPGASATSTNCIRINLDSGDARWVPAGSPRTAGEASRTVQVELKGTGKPAAFGKLDPVRLAPKSYRVVLDNPQVRVLHVRIGAKQKVPFHEHVLNRVVVYVTDSHMRIVDGAGKATEAATKAGEVRWAGPGKHSEENLAPGDFVVAVVEVK
jgi:hypothetical protein